MKMIKKDCLDLTAQHNDDFIDEIYALRQLDHCNIIKLFEYFESDNHYYLILEHCLGEDLGEILMKKKRFKEEKLVIKIMR
mmetsp:Transcript_87498/g.120562  ORF Transcript_87498/g.120562 Transcript_87498/m.120562 type:complete len:81 (+) Transcript_87498:539-781(+)